MISHLEQSNLTSEKTTLNGDIATDLVRPSEKESLPFSDGVFGPRSEFQRSEKTMTIGEILPGVMTDLQRRRERYCAGQERSFHDD